MGGIREAADCGRSILLAEWDNDAPLVDNANQWAALTPELISVFLEFEHQKDQAGQ
jgi:hypothetical protein